MINASILSVGAALGTGVKYAVPTIEQYYPGQGGEFMQLVMEQLAGQGVPAAAGLVNKNISGAMNYTGSSFDSQNPGAGQDTSRGRFD